QETFAEAALVGGESLKQHFHDRDTTCLKCPVACGKQYAIREGEFAGTRAKMPEYESIFALGPMLGIAEPEALILANDLCDLLGLDTISMGVTLAFVCEALERGWLSEKDVGGRTAVERGRVLRRRPRVVMAAAAGRGRIADREPLERARRVRRQLQPLHRVHEPRAFRMDGFRQPPGALGQAIAETLAPRRHLHQPQHAAPLAPAE